MNKTPRLDLRDGRFVLTRPWTAMLPDGRYIIVPAGVETNFASVPAWARLIISPIDPHISGPAIAHDYLVGEFAGQTGFRPIILNPDHSLEDSHVDWDQAATILRQMMKALGAPAWKRGLIYAAVRLYGWARGR